MTLGVSLVINLLSPNPPQGSKRTFLQSYRTRSTRWEHRQPPQMAELQPDTWRGCNRRKLVGFTTYSWWGVESKVPPWEWVQQRMDQVTWMSVPMSRVDIFSNSFLRWRKWLTLAICFVCLLSKCSNEWPQSRGRVCMVTTLLNSRSLFTYSFGDAVTNSSCFSLVCLMGECSDEWTLVMLMSVCTVTPLINSRENFLFLYSPILKHMANLTYCFNLFAWWNLRKN